MGRPATQLSAITLREIPGARVPTVCPGRQVPATTGHTALRDATYEIHTLILGNAITGIPAFE